MLLHNKQEGLSIGNVLHIAFFMASLLLWAYMLFAHDVFEEWDGVAHYFSGIEFWDSGVYTGWASHFWPPLQPLVVSLGDPLLIGKLVSALSGALLLVVLYYFLDSFKLTNSQKSTVLLLVLSSSFFITSFSVVENHALETVLYISGLHFFILSETKKSIRLLALSAVLIALAGLSRYTSYTLALAIGLYLLLQFRKCTLLKFIVFSTIFAGVSSLWWLPNFLMNGSPLSTWQYQNIGSRVHPEGAYKWWWINQKDYSSLAQLVLSYPKAFLLNFLSNIVTSGTILVQQLTSNLITSLLLFVFMAYLVLREKLLCTFLSQNRLYVICICFFVMLSSTAFVFAEALLPIIILGLVTSVSFVIKASSKRITFVYFLYFVICCNLVFNMKHASDYIEYQADSGGQLSDLESVNSIISEYKKSDSIISSIHPARAYYAGTSWIHFPLAGAESICDIVNYEFPKRIIERAPKYPASLVDNLNIDFLVITSDLAKLFDFISEDFELDTYQCDTKTLRPIFMTSETSVFYVFVD